VDTEGVLAELTKTAEALGIEVRSQALRGSHPSHGGLCRLAGRTVVLLSSRATSLERCTVLAQALAQLGHVDHPALGLESRELIGRRGRPHPPPTKPRTRTGARPGLAGLGRDGRRRG
jgi:hypothetical protein